MEQKLKVVTVVGTRPEIIRLSRTMFKLDNTESIDHKTIHTGQNFDYELNQIFYEDMEIRKPDFYLDAAGSSAMETIGNIFIKIDSLLESLNPDAILVLGDTNSCLCAVPAKRRHIPVFHMEAGNRCFDQRVPEEINRKIIDHIADVNLPYSDIAREYLLREGYPPDRIIKTGSPMYEVLNYYLPKIKSSDILNKLGVENDKYFVVSAHREENVNNDNRFKDLINTLNTVAEEFKFPIIVSTHPRTKKIIEQSKIKVNEGISFIKPLGFIDYNSLQISARAVLSDSGTISEESSILNFRALNIREAHERPEAMEQASVMMVGLKAERILQALKHLQYQKTGDSREFFPVSDYSMPNVSDKVVRIILSYTDYIRRTIWHE